MSDFVRSASLHESRARALAARDAAPLARPVWSVPWDRETFAALGVEVPEFRGPTFADRYRANTAGLQRRRTVEEWSARGHVEEAEEARTREAVRQVHGRMSDAEIRAQASARARLLAREVLRLDVAGSAADLLAWLNARIEPLQARPWTFGGDRPEGDQLRSMLARASCHLWWRRQLRRAAVQLREEGARRACEVSASRREVYVSDDTARRHLERAAANAAMLEAAEIEAEDGTVCTLAQAAAASTSNKAIRRGELMTRIRGCEELAALDGWRGLFLTLTAPEEFHRVLRHGAPNPGWRGASPRDAHLWLCAAWAKSRAALQRAGVGLYGFRVAEPHHDGTPHWHMLVWVRPGHRWALQRTLERYFVLNELRPRKVAPIHARGCKGRRGWAYGAGGIFTALGRRRWGFDLKAMAAGDAAGYIAKYIAKGLDDAGAVGAEGHRDDGCGIEVGAVRDGVPVGAVPVARSGEREAAQGELFGGTAKRVEAWASAHRIRQFQALGQPPVTVWRELRRVQAQAQAGATDRMAEAFVAVNRDGARRADWARYVIAQGGTCRGRDYLLRLATEAREVRGRYETVERPRPWGVLDVTGPGDVHLSSRKDWKPRGQWLREEEARPVLPASYVITSGGTVAPSRAHAAAIEAARVEGSARGSAQPRTRANNCTRPVIIDGREIDFRAHLRWVARIGIDPGEGRNLKGGAPCPKNRPPGPSRN